MRKNIKCLVLLSTVSNIATCPFTMSNDGKQDIIVFDVQNKQAVRIEPGTSAFINPMLRGWRKYLRRETLDIYLERKDQKNRFERRYRFTEKYCPVDAKQNKISLTDIENIAQNPTDRARVQVFKPEGK